MMFFVKHKIPHKSQGQSHCGYYIALSNEILDWEGVGNRQLLCFFKVLINWSMLTANLKFKAKNVVLFFFAMFYIKNRIT
jgi:hypothetical protein